MTENRSSSQKYAMHFGTYMGIYWIMKFILFPIGLSIPFLLLLFIGMTLGVPFMGYYYARMYRNKVCGGYIGFLPAWVFTVFMYMFASLLTAVAHYIYFQYIDGGFVLEYYRKSITEAQQLPGMGTYMNQFNQIIDQLGALTPIDITLQLLSMNVFYCSILAIPTALFVMRRNKTVANPQS